MGNFFHVELGLGLGLVRSSVELAIDSDGYIQTVAFVY